MTTPSSVPKPREIGIIENVSDAMVAIGRLSSPSEGFNCFRGHGSIGWTVQPSIFRQPEGVINSEYLIVRDLISRYPDEFLNDKTMFDKLVRMQHFGLPTRLMDVTSNPLVAMYFSSTTAEDADGALIVLRVPADRKKYFDSDSISCICNLANLKQPEKSIIEETRATVMSDFNALNAVNRLYQFIREEKPHFQQRIKREDLFRPYYVVPKLNNRRIIAQSGAFIAFGAGAIDPVSSSKGIKMYSLRIPYRAKSEIMKELGMLGINSSSLFPEIDKAAEHITQMYA